jgi:hypothetical protein
VALARLVEVDRAEHHPVVGDRHRRHAQLRRPPHERVDAGGAVEHRVLGVNVQVGKGIGHCGASSVALVGRMTGVWFAVLDGTNWRRCGEVRAPYRDAATARTRRLPGMQRAAATTTPETVPAR